jgi:hypothetical protein
MHAGEICIKLQQEASRRKIRLQKMDFTYWDKDWECRPNLFREDSGG